MDAAEPKQPRQPICLTPDEVRALVALRVTDQHGDNCGSATLQDVAEALEISPAEAAGYLQRVRDAAEAVTYSANVQAPTAIAQWPSGEDLLALGFGFFLLKGLVVTALAVCLLVGVVLWRNAGSWASIAGIVIVLAAFAWAASPRRDGRSRPKSHRPGR
jgi:hypothetical protein